MFHGFLANAFLHTCGSKGINFIFARTTKSNEFMIFDIIALTSLTHCK